MRNVNNPYHSKGVNQNSFNDKRYADLATTSRFREEPPSPKRQPEFYDIKGNTYKGTLIPSETALSEMNKFSNTFTDGFMAKSVPRVKPVDNRGYKRSGMILFGNINQINVSEQKVPTAVDKIKTRNSSVFDTGVSRDKNATADPTLASTLS